MNIDDFGTTLDYWIKELDHFELKELNIKPSEESWSLGQLYMHLINETKYYMDQVKICISSNENANRNASPEAINMFQNNEFPNITIAGPDSGVKVPQPNGIKELKIDLNNVKDEVHLLFSSCVNTTFHGKSKHPGLNYFSGEEWLQFADMHFRHHLRQKQRIEAFLRELVFM